MKDTTSTLLQSLCAVIGMSAASTGSATMVISELLYDVSGPDRGLVFMELYGAPGSDLNGLEIEGINGTNGSIYKRVSLTGVMPPDGVFVIGDDDGSGASQVPNVDLVADIDMQNGPDSVVLRDASGILDALGYGDFATAVFAGEGTPATDVATGWSLARRHPWLDTDDNGVDFIALDVPTPGLVPASPVPLPATAWLFFSGLLGLVGVARRKN